MCQVKSTESPIPYLSCYRVTQTAPNTSKFINVSYCGIIARMIFIACWLNNTTGDGYEFKQADNVVNTDQQPSVLKGA